VVKQIVGLIARRIIFDPKMGDALRRGDRIGMIKFGSRTELYVPLWLGPQAKVQIGQTVRGGADILVVLSQPIHTMEPAKSVGNEFEPLIGRETPA
jgi:phosphatidylserine decarboxylase